MGISIPLVNGDRRWRYRMAGLEIESELPLREAVSLTHRPPADLVVLDGQRHGLPRPPATNAHTPDAGRVRFVAPGVGRFVVEEGRRVVAWLDAAAESSAVSQQVSGSALALALMQRGTLVLHASVVQIGRAALLVTGNSGDGKSTLAAACAAAGHGIVADDLAVVDQSPDGWTVRRIAPVVRLESRAAASLPYEEAWQADGKVVQRLSASPVGEDVPVGGIVCLAWDSPVTLTRMGAVEAALSLIGHAYCAPAFREVQTEATLRQCAELAGACPMWLLARPRDHNHLTETVTLLADTLTALA